MLTLFRETLFCLPKCETYNYKTAHKPGFINTNVLEWGRWKIFFSSTPTSPITPNLVLRKEMWRLWRRPATGGEGRHLLFLASYWPMGLHKKLLNIPTARPVGVNNPPFFTFWNIYNYYTYIIRFLKRLHCEIIFIRSFYRNSWIFKKKLLHNIWK